jgi:hypothetical protein
MIEAMETHTKSHEEKEDMEWNIVDEVSSKEDSTWEVS